MKIFCETLHIQTQGRGLVDVTAKVDACVARSAIRDGLCAVFLRHTSASLLVQENADPSVQRDLERWLAALAPEAADYEHDAEGPDDMPAHLRAAVLRTSEQLPVRDGRLALGTWQALYVYEHRREPHSRTLELTVLGS